MHIIFWAFGSWRTFLSCLDGGNIGCFWAERTITDCHSDGHRGHKKQLWTDERENINSFRIQPYYVDDGEPN